MSNGQSPAGLVARSIATLFGAGRSPIVPGTAGTLAAVPLVFVAARFLPLWAYLVATLVLTLAGVWSSGRTAGDSGRKDPGEVVIDEAAGLFVTMAGLPADLPTMAAGFFLFRVMDIVKPPPARRAERLPGGWGIMVDDLVAGVYANLALRVLQLLYRSLAA